MSSRPDDLGLLRGVAAPLISVFENSGLATRAHALLEEALRRSRGSPAMCGITAASVTPFAKCNVCGGSEFEHGSADRLSCTGRLRRCSTCYSLERHRVARRIFLQLQDYLTGKRFLQFSPDPAVDPSWFSEMTTSVWDGENSLDMQAIALPAGRYDWIYSSHVLNSVPDQPAALREMLRVVGDQGFVALCVGGTVFTYKTRPSNADFGRDKQFVLYGTEFADDIQAVLPDVAVIELVAVDPCTASLDSIYVYSRAEQTLREMAERAVADNIHIRVFPARLVQTALGGG